MRGVAEQSLQIFCKSKTSAMKTSLRTTQTKLEADVIVTWRGCSLGGVSGRPLWDGHGRGGCHRPRPWGCTDSGCFGAKGWGEQKAGSLGISMGNEALTHPQPRPSESGVEATLIVGRRRLLPQAVGPQAASKGEP